MEEQNNIQQLNPKSSLTKWKIAISVGITALIVGGGVCWWQRIIVRDAKNESARAKQQMNELKTKVSKLQIELEISLLRPQRASFNIEEKLPGNFFKIYGQGINGTDKEIDFYIGIPKDLSLLEKLRILADRLSSFKFGYLPINVLRIGNRNNKKIAVISLREKQYKDRYNWYSYYFQGSAGGQATEITLKESFLQKDYKGEWIDGVEFYYEGKPMEEEWAHISLTGIISR